MKQSIFGYRGYNQMMFLLLLGKIMKSLLAAGEGGYDKCISSLSKIPGRAHSDMPLKS